MKSEIKQPTDGQILHNWLDSVPFGDYSAVRARMVAECMVSKQVFANWLYGVSRIPMLAKSVMNAVSTRYNGSIIFELAGIGVEGESNATGNAL